MAAPLALRSVCSVQINRPAQLILPATASTVRPRSIGLPRQNIPRTARVQHVARVSDTDGTVDVDAIVKDLQSKWDGVENKTSVVLYAGGALVLLWLSSSLVSAVNAIPVLPKLLELVGLGYTAWFVYRYLLFKSSREELIQDVEELKKRVSGAASETSGRISKN